MSFFLTSPQVIDLGVNIDHVATLRQARGTTYPDPIRAALMAEEAGALALDYFNRRETLVIEQKRDPQDVVSVADREVENLIRKRVAEKFPDDGFLGEEYGLQPGTSGLTWVVDPIDGTSPFVNGMPNWCVSIALLKDEEPIIGVIAAPCHQEVYAAAAGRGVRE